MVQFKKEQMASDCEEGESGNQGKIRWDPLGQSSFVWDDEEEGDEDDIFETE